MIKVFDMEIIQNTDMEIKDTGSGDLLISTTDGGCFTGEHITGKVLPMGFGTSFSDGKGTNNIRVSLVLETWDKEKIMMELEAKLLIDVETEAKLMRGEKVSPELYYYKGVVRFYNGSLQYDWLNHRLFICDGIIESWQSLKFEVYEP